MVTPTKTFESLIRNRNEDAEVDVNTNDEHDVMPKRQMRI